MSGWPTNLGELRAESSMDHWWPRLKELDVPTPDTIAVPCDQPDERLPRGKPDMNAIIDAGLEVGGPPAFIRTDQASAKHSMASASKLPEGTVPTVEQHVRRLLEFNATADMIGLPYETVYVREWLDLWHTYEAFEHTPIAAEVRFYLLDGEVYDWAVYWPTDAIKRHEERHEHEPPLPDDWRDRHGEMVSVTETVAEELVDDHALTVADAFDGYWSCDFALAEDEQVYAIDMARGEISHHPDDIEPARRPEFS